MSQLPPICSLMSPPDKPFDTFEPSPKQIVSQAVLQPPLCNQERNIVSSRLSPQHENNLLDILPSPPISPWTGHESRLVGHGHRPAHDGGQLVRDPVLYPEDDGADEALIEEAMFLPETRELLVEDVVDRHIATNHLHFRAMKSQPTREEYLFAASCVPKLGHMYNLNPGAYMKRTREETEKYYFMARRISGQPGVQRPKNITIAPAPASVVRQP